MKIPKKLDYACRVLIQLARRYDTDTLSQLDELSQCEDVSSNFLAQILTDLRRAGLIESRRGKGGGYLLSRPPGTITLYDIIILFQGHLLEFSPRGKGASSPNVTATWKRLDEALQKETQAVTLDRMMEETDGEAPMYFI